ncbi:MAG: endolytic transglycosylase MltG [Candidatus Microsaccharimonas sp.]
MESKKPTEPKPPLPIDMPSPQPIESSPSGLDVKKKWSKKKKILFFVALNPVVLVLGLLTAGYLWYQSQLDPVAKGTDDLVKITIEQNSTPASIGSLLAEKKVIKSSEAFSIYIRLSGTQNKLQAGSYRLSPGDSTPEIVNHLTKGNVDTFNITFLPGATLADNKKVLTAAGYGEDEVTAALAASYDSPLFDGKPSSADLEGYIYGETYNFATEASVKDILARTFSQYNTVVVENWLVAAYKARGLSLYQGITLASIIQREASGGDEAQIAQVFYSRMAQGMVLGSDVTYQYIADKTGVARDPNLDSLYNTRRYPGLPPGPISVPGLAALKAVANPAAGEYLFFLSGDDDVTYFARTNAEHEQNIVDHCKVKCSIL